MQHIKDNFYYKSFCDFKVIYDKQTGYFNASKLCKQGEKKFSDWVKISKNKIDYVNNSTKFFEIKLDKNKLNQQISGTYISEDLLLDLTLWIFPSFYSKCNKFIIKHNKEIYEEDYNEEPVSTYDDKFNSILKKIIKTINANNVDILKETKNITKILEENKIQIDEIQEDIEMINDKLNNNSKKQDALHRIYVYKNASRENDIIEEDDNILEVGNSDNTNNDVN